MLAQQLEEGAARFAARLRRAGDVSAAAPQRIFEKLAFEAVDDGALLRSERTRPLRRGRLGIIAAEKVLPIWTYLRPDDDRPRRLLDHAERALATGREQDMPAELSRFDLDLDDLRYEVPGTGGELMAGYAAVSAYRVAVDDQAFDPDHVAQPDDYDHADPARDASAAAAYGAPASAQHDPARRRAFWLWWLREAVPAAFSAVPSR